MFLFSQIYFSFYSQRAKINCTSSLKIKEEKIFLNLKPLFNHFINPFLILPKIKKYRFTQYTRTIIIIIIIYLMINKDIMHAIE
jgi:hypothetical protein